MATNSQASSSGGIGFFGLLAVLFIGLKLTGFIDWSWVWVLAPIWIPLGIFLVIVSLLGLYLLWENKGRSKKARNRRTARAVQDYGRAASRRRT